MLSRVLCIDEKCDSRFDFQGHNVKSNHLNHCVSAQSANLSDIFFQIMYVNYFKNSRQYFQSMSNKCECKIAINSYSEFYDMWPPSENDICFSIFHLKFIDIHNYFHWCTWRKYIQTKEITIRMIFIIEMLLTIVK